MAMKATIGGVLAVFQTPFDGTGELDMPATERCGGRLFENRANGIVFAVVSEVRRLWSEERDIVAEVTCRICAGRGTCVICVRAESAGTAARHAGAIGVGAVMSALPTSFPCGDKALLSSFTAMIDTAEIPLVMHDARGDVGRPLTVEVQTRLHREFGTWVLFRPGVHAIGPRLTMLMGTCDRDAHAFEGTGGRNVVDSFRRGATGTMPAGDAFWALSARWESLVAGDFDCAYSIAAPVALIISVRTSLDNFVPTEKCMVHRQGVLGNPVMRGPYRDVVDEQAHDEIERRVALLRQRPTVPSECTP